METHASFRGVRTASFREFVPIFLRSLDVGSVSPDFYQIDEVLAGMIGFVSQRSQFWGGCEPPVTRRASRFAEGPFFYKLECMKDIENEIGDEVQTVINYPLARLP